MLHRKWQMVPKVEAPWVQLGGEMTPLRGTGRAAQAEPRPGTEDKGPEFQSLGRETPVNNTRLSKMKDKRRQSRYLRTHLFACPSHMPDTPQVLVSGPISRKPVLQLTLQREV